MDQSLDLFHGQGQGGVLGHGAEKAAGCVEGDDLHVPQRTTCRISRVSFCNSTRAHALPWERSLEKGQMLNNMPRQDRRSFCGTNGIPLTRLPCLLKVALLLLHVGQVNIGFLLGLGARGREHIHQGFSHCFGHLSRRSTHNNDRFLVAKSVEDNIGILPYPVLNIYFLLLVSGESCYEMQILVAGV
jgi:hypothetical protein